MKSPISGDFNSFFLFLDHSLFLLRFSFKTNETFLRFGWLLPIYLLKLGFKTDIKKNIL